jgi:GcrA cell cycle regulator
VGRMKNAPSLEWNASELTTLRSMWLEQRTTATAISDALGTTRSAVLGKIRRLGLTRNVGANRRKPPRTMTAPFPFIARAKRKPPPVSRGPVHFRALEQHHCRWMPGEVSTLMYCGAERSDGSPYCSHHTRISYSSTA